MDDTEPAPDEMIPESSEPNEDKPEESGFTNQVIEEEAAPEETPVREDEEETVTLTQETIRVEEEEPMIPYQEAEETPVKEEEEEPTPLTQETEETPVKEEEEGKPPSPYQEAEETPIKEEELPSPYQEAEETPVKEEKEEEPPPLTQETEETPLKDAEEEHPIPSQAVDLSDTALVRSAISNQPTDASLNREVSARKSTLKIKERTSSSIQTSLIWEHKPLAEVLQDKPELIKPVYQVSEVTEKAGDVVTEHRVVQEYFHSAEDFGEEPPQGDSQPAKAKESQLPVSEPEAPTQQIEKIENRVSQDSRRDTEQSPENKIPSLLKLTSDTRNEEGPVWINPKTGKEMRCSFNQTNQNWERKPLAEILRASSTKREIPSWESGNGGDPTRAFGQRIHIPYNPEDPEWIGYPNPFEY